MSVERMFVEVAHALSMVTCFAQHVYRVGFLLILVSKNASCNHICGDTKQLDSFGNPVQFSTFANSSNSNYCQIFVNSPTSNAISVNVLNSIYTNPTAYFYVEVLVKSESQSACPFVSVSIDQLPCSATIRGNQFIFHFYDSQTTFEVRTKHATPMTTCPDTVTKPPEEEKSCDISMYHGEFQQEIQKFKFEYHTFGQFSFDKPTLILNVAKYLANCECSCFVPCTCTLGYRQWLTSCSDSTNRKTIRNYLVVYKPTIEGASFANTGLHAIQPNAFSGLESIRALILEHNNIKSLPSTICNNVPQLQILKLGHNLLTNIPIDMFNGSCKQPLLWLDLNENLLTTIANGVLDHLSNLRRLDLNQNKLTILSNNSFGTMEQLNYLNLSGNMISVLPLGIFKPLRLLLALNLSINFIHVLPQGVFKTLDRMWNLDLSENEIAVIPVGVFNFKSKLTAIDLSGNRIHTLPNDLFNPLNHWLGHLYLSNNNISTLPIDIFSSNPQSLLYTLDLSSNVISYLHFQIFKPLTNLRVLNLSSNTIYSLPESMFNSLKNLISVDLSNNRITSVPATLSSNQTDGDLITTNFDLSHNQIADLPALVFHSLPKLKRLDLSHNSIIRLQDTHFTAQEDLLFLDLSYNNITELPRGVFATPCNLISLNLGGNRISIVTSNTAETFSDLKILDLSKNRLGSLPYRLLSSMNNLSELDLSENALKDISSHAFEHLSALIVLNMSKNMLETLPSFRAQIKLLVLDLSLNRISLLTPDMFSRLENLIFLSLYGNRVLQLSMRAFDNLLSLQFVTISHNAIQIIDSGIFSKSPKLSTLDLRGNALKQVHRVSFIGLRNSTILVDEYATCCFIGDHDAECVSRTPRSQFLTCNRMLHDIGLRIMMWILGMVAFIGNGAALYYIMYIKQGQKIRQGITIAQNMLLSNLAVSDLLMGVNMLLLSSADAYYHEYFPSYSQIWRQGSFCKLAGFLSVLSSEGSVFFITLISIDRLICVKYPLSHNNLRRTKKYLRICILVAWLTALFLSSMSIGLSTSENGYSLSEVCIGFPIVRGHLLAKKNETVQINEPFVSEKNKFHVDWPHGFKVLKDDPMNITTMVKRYNMSRIISINMGSELAPVLSIVIFVGINLTCFTIVAFCYMHIFISAWKSSKQVSRTQKHVIRMAKRMFALVFTDFCCWVPLSITCVLAQCGVVTISPAMYAWAVGFILPINSVINPFLYTIYDIISERLKKWHIERSFEMTVRGVQVENQEDKTTPSSPTGTQSTGLGLSCRGNPANCVIKT